MKLQNAQLVRQLIFGALFIWIVVLFYISWWLFNLQSKEKFAENNGNLLDLYGKAIKELQVLKKRNEVLYDKLKSLKGQKKCTPDENYGAFRLSQEHEISRRDLDNSIRELYFYLISQFDANKGLSFSKHASDQLVSLLGRSAALSDVDGAALWRKKELSNISASFMTAIDDLQNPKDCNSARKLVCNLDKECGFGCQLHHVTYCFMVAFGMNRTLVLSEDGRLWSYSNDGWSAVFLPVTRCHFSAVKAKDQLVEWKSTDAHASNKVIKLPPVDGLSGRPDFLPLMIPRSLSVPLLTLHSNPPVFIVSQFLRYLMRPSTNVASIIEKAAAKIPFEKGPIVGLQIRRTDKIGTEAAFHELDEYMKWAEHWFKIEEHKTRKKLKRRIFIATDDSSIFNEIKKYKTYEIYGDKAIADTAQLRHRYSTDSLYGVIVDIEMLARCDYLVCTFSSQVCRMGYELMQYKVGDAGERFHSLDDIYYFGGQHAHEQIAVENYTAEGSDEIDLRIGDVIGIAGNHWNGFSKGVNRRTGRIGLYPSYKVKEKWRIVKFP